MKRPKTFQCALLAAAFTLYLAGSVVGVWGSMVGLAVLVGLRKNLHPLIWVTPFLLIGIMALPSSIVAIAQFNAEIALGHDAIKTLGKIGASLSLEAVATALHDYDYTMSIGLPLTQIVVLFGAAPLTFICSSFIWSRLKKHVFALIPELNVP